MEQVQAIRNEKNVLRVDRSLYKEADLAIIVPKDEPLTTIKYFRDEYDLELEMVAFVEDIAAIHFKQKR